MDKMNALKDNNRFSNGFKGFSLIMIQLTN
jgi:hypothetical protein